MKAIKLLIDYCKGLPFLDDGEPTLKQIAENAEAELKTLCRVEPDVMQVACDRCDGCGNKKTYENQVCMPLNGRVVCIDWCIHQIVAALNAGGVETVACCCGHNTTQGRIDLADGRILFISKPSA